MITLREAIGAHLAGGAMAMAIIIGLVPGMVQMMRGLHP